MSHKPQRILINDEQVVGVVTELQDLAAGTHDFDVEVRGNAAISTVYVEDAGGATIDVAWLDFNPLATSAVLNQVDAHPSISAPGYYRRFISKLHQGNSRVRVTVTGGTARMGIYATALQVLGTYPIDGGVQVVSGGSSGAPSMGKIENLELTTAALEYAHTFPAGTKGFSIRSRTPAILQLAYDLGESGTIYKTIPAGAFLEVSPLSGSALVTLYLQSPKPSIVAELESWA